MIITCHRIGVLFMPTSLSILLAIHTNRPPYNFFWAPQTQFFNVVVAEKGDQNDDASITACHH